MSNKNYVIDNIVVNNHGLLGLTPNNETVYTQPSLPKINRRVVLEDVTGDAEKVTARTKTPPKSMYEYGVNDNVTGTWIENVTSRNKTPNNEQLFTNNVVNKTPNNEQLFTNNVVNNTLTNEQLYDENTKKNNVLTNEE